MFSRCFPGRRSAAALLLALLTLALAPGMTRAAHAADADTIIGAVDDAMRQADRARDAYDRVRTSGDRDATARYEREWRDSEYKLEDARIENLSRESGMSPARIRSMRESGMGWGQVAKEAGAHPGSLGVGHSKGKKGSWNRDDDRDLYRDYYRDRHGKAGQDKRDKQDRTGRDKGRHADDGDRDGKSGKGGKHDKGDTRVKGDKGDKAAKNSKDGKHGRDDYLEDGKGKGKGKK